jgi:cytosine/adenosine deaminase-related metal-dependent hydrolase
MRIVHADAVVTGDAGSIADGAVVLDGALVVDVGPASDVLPRHAGPPVERVRGAVLPGLVNAHTHIELSALRGQVPGGAGFVPWVERMLGARVAAEPELDTAAIELAVGELDRFGTAAVGEVTNSLAAVGALAQRGIAGAVFHEVFGVELEQLERRVADLPRQLEETVGTWPTPDLVYAPAPHTLFTTHADVVRRLIDDARRKGVRTSLHLAEHAAERTYLERGAGPIRDFFRSRLKLPDDRMTWPGKSPVAFGEELGALAPHVLGVHLTDATTDELAQVARHEMPVVFCPRSNLYIETRLPPLIAARAAGISPALGTDSLASNASLDVLAEARALADRFSTVPARDLVRMATWQGACALSRPDLGRIAAGSRPGLVAIDGAVPGDGCAFVLSQVKAPRRWVVRRGEVSS